MEIYVDQDHCNQREAPFTVIGCDKSQVATSQNPFITHYLATKLLIKKLYFTNHMKIAEIAELTYRSHQYISKVIKQNTPKKTK
jgi:hypothetical protein